MASLEKLGIQLSSDKSYDSYDSLKMKDIKSRETLIIKCITEISDVLVIVIDKFSALE